MATAFLFPGQGSQYVGMGSDLADRYDEARGIFETADSTLGFDLSGIMFGSGDEDADREALKQTEVTQPSLFVHSMAVHRVLEAKGITAEMAAGHSLGEYSALCAAGAVSFEEGLKVVRLRGELMASAGTRRPGTMAAVIGLDDAVVESLCGSITEGGVVQPANFNSPGQVVISGDVDAVKAAMDAASEAGARRVIPLPVSGAFHSPLMQDARDGLAEALEDLTIRTPGAAIYLNVTAEPTRDPDEIRRRLLEQLMAPVRWSQSLARMQEDGASRFVEIGAGRVLSGLVKRTLGRQAATTALGTVDDLESLITEDD